MLSGNIKASIHIFRIQLMICLSFLFELISCCSGLLKRVLDGQGQDVTFQTLYLEGDMSSSTTNNTNEAYAFGRLCNFQSCFINMLSSDKYDSDLSCLEWGLCECDCKWMLLLTKRKIAKLSKGVRLTHKPMLCYPSSICKSLEWFHRISFSAIIGHANSLTIP